MLDIVFYNKGVIIVVLEVHCTWLKYSLNYDFSRFLPLFLSAHTSQQFKRNLCNRLYRIIVDSIIIWDSIDHKRNRKCLREYEQIGFDSISFESLKLISVNSETVVFTWTTLVKNGFYLGSAGKTDFLSNLKHWFLFTRVAMNRFI